MANKRGRFPKLPEETQKLILDAELAKEEQKEEKLLELKRGLKKEATICGAMKNTGKICLREPFIKDDGSTNGRCQFHGGKSTGATTEEGRLKQMANLEPKANLIHGVYSKDFKSMLTQEEVGLYNYIVNWFCDNFEVDPINLGLLDRYIMNQIKALRLDSIDFLRESREYNDVEMKMLRFAESLGLNKRFKDSKENKDNVEKIDIATLLGGEPRKEIN
ncbi:HGGxSTG domain-containing protein [Metabacillus bambusae]|uniref:Terminase small subunit n=1 Tax=Metabacillus bambusae TaxID=2795218 RepID=A0ABS3MZX7_9BACI|nr:HGGxSTG domain-containing protein [Metabacillus bambusae]MBO1511544.1 hypothetical protein [Metabacillus bambusae]